MSYRIVLEKENFKFSVSHFTIFGPDEAERLHGHNYYVTVDLGIDKVEHDLGLAFDFNTVKPIIREIADHLDEYVLLPELSPHLEIERKQNSVRATLKQTSKHKLYELPNEDVRLLPMTNVTAEELARYVSVQLLEKMRLRCPSVSSSLKTLSIGIQESRGQSVYYSAPLADVGAAQ